MTGDWITVHRKLLTNPVMQHDGLFRLWMYCLMKAAWKDGKWLVPGTTTVMDVKRGQFITGRESLHGSLYSSEYSGEHKPSSRTVWRWLESLAAMECITLNTVSNRCTIVTVVKYNTYQKDKQVDVQPMSVSCPADSHNLGNPPQNVSNPAQQSSDCDSFIYDDTKKFDVQHMSSTCPADVPHMSTVEEGNKGINKEGRSTASRFTPPTVSEVSEYCLERQNEISATKFVAHYESVGWKVGRNPMKNWKAAVRKWEQNDFNKKPTTPKLCQLPTEEERKAWRPS